MPPQRNLLLAFDAFGTLYKPKRPVALQYAEVARSLGLTGFEVKEVEREFRAAFKREVKAHPNYGKASGMNATKWWTNIIQATFAPLTSPSAHPKILSELVPRLLYRFSTEDGYTIFPDVIPLMQGLPKESVVVGVVTNSDDRVPNVLISLGLRVSPFRYDKELIKNPEPNEVYDVDFSVMSYDVGTEKPDKRIFEAAEEMLAVTPLGAGSDEEVWDRVYVGNDLEKDVLGALNSGWKAVLIDRECEPTSRSKEVVWLDDRPAGKLEDIFASEKAVGFGSLAKLAEWLPKSS